MAEPDVVPVLRNGPEAAGAEHRPWVEDFAALESAVAGTTAFDGATVDPAASALFVFSSGSTGTPKGMIRTNRNLVAEADQFAATVDVTEDDVILAVALFHAHGLGNALLAAFRSGAPLVLGRFERDATLAAYRQERVTLFPAVPFIFHSLAETGRAERCRPAIAAAVLLGRRAARRRRSTCSTTASVTRSGSSTGAARRAR